MEDDTVEDFSSIHLLLIALLVMMLMVMFDWKSFLPKWFRKSHRILFLGLDNSGKTTLVHMLNAVELMNHPPSSRPEQLTVQLGPYFVNLIDGGFLRGRRSLEGTVQGVHGIVFCIDVADAERLPEAVQELQVSTARAPRPCN